MLFKARLFLFLGALSLGFMPAACSAGAPAATVAPTSVSSNVTSAPTAADIPTSASASITAAPTTTTIAPAATSAQAMPTTASASGAQVAAVINPVDNGKINLNNMTQEQLLNGIPNFTSRMVREFFEYQPYVSIQQFRREIGKYVGGAQVAEYEQYVYVPVDVNNSDAATLLQIPGLDEATAAALLTARPYGSNADFLAKLGELLPTAQLDVVAGYLAE